MLPAHTYIIVPAYREAAVIRQTLLSLLPLGAQIILVDDATIKKMHKQWFNDGSATDVITFPVVEEPPIEAEIYISIDTAKRNAERFGVTLTNELCRLAVHGALHIAGYDDATDELRTAMHHRENRYLARL